MANRFIITSLILLPCMIALLGCQRQDASEVPSTTGAMPAAIGQPSAAGQSSSSAPKIVFRDPIEPAVYELPSQALATWREHASTRPTLLLFANHPLLSQVSGERRQLIARLLKTGSAAEIVHRARLLCSDPAILPPEAVSVAIDYALFSEIIVVLPNSSPPEEINLDRSRALLFQAGFLTESEALGLSLNNGSIIGTVRGMPFQIPHPDLLPDLDRPIVLHVDLGYFRDSYKDEIKTPSYDLLYTLASSLRDSRYKVLATTLSYSNQEVDFSLESRFMIRDLATLLRQPQLLDGGTPASWTLRAGALYANAMFSNERGRDLTEQAVQATPDDAAAHYARALDLFGQRLADQGFAALDRAVALDRGYALEYLTLAERGLEMQNRDKAIELLRNAVAALPEDPFIRLRLADLLIQTGRGKEARPILQYLRRLNWSEEIYPHIPKLLAEMQDVAANAQPPVDMPRPKGPSLKSPTERTPGFEHMGKGAAGD